MNEEYTFDANIEEIYYREMRQYKRVLTKEEEQKYLSVIEKYRDYIKENDIHYESIKKELANIPELKNEIIELNDYNLHVIDEYIDYINENVTSIDEHTKEKLIYKLKVFKLYQESFINMIKHNLLLGASIAKRYYKQYNTLISFIDLIQESNIGLIKALERYKTIYDTKFSTYATWWINQVIRRSIIDKGQQLRIPVHQFEKINCFKKAREKLINQGIEPTYKNIYEIMLYDYTKKKLQTEDDAEIKANLEKMSKLFTIDQVIEFDIEYQLNKVTYLDEPLIGENEEANPNTKNDIIADKNTKTPEEIYITKSKKEMVKQLLNNSHLDTKQLIVICLRYGIELSNYLTEEEIIEFYTKTNGKNLEEFLKYYKNISDGYTLEQVGKVLGVTRERIRQIENKALYKIKIHTRRNNINYKSVQ